MDGILTDSMGDRNTLIVAAVLLRTDVGDCEGGAAPANVAVVAGREVGTVVSPEPLCLNACKESNEIR